MWLEGRAIRPNQLRRSPNCPVAVLLAKVICLQRVEGLKIDVVLYKKGDRGSRV